MSNFNLDEAIQILERTPHILRTFLESLSTHWVSANEGQNTWSAYDIVGHLIHGEKTDWIPRMKIILYETEKTFVPFDRFAQFEESKGKSLDDLLDEFESLRSANITALKNAGIGDEHLQVGGIHPELGPVTLSELLAAWVVHDLGHISQISRVMAKRYTADIGPWTAYMPIVNR